MALLTLKDIGKIYVSEGSVAVGIRGVNLSFDRGEFVAVTGKSGSGKSTLLNVISGMDSYEEGELLIEGQSTSHYLQPEWEEYREKYISFIFQDYNIIESFTVLQNVELALMHIEDRKERRRRALELLDRVGMTSHIRQKGSKLSGGQKQRTVIARALAKDSPIILADEPTGNLDSATSAEIIALLREVSKDKLLIVVTHNFEQVEACATRHIRVFDGAVESDHIISKPCDASKNDPRKTSDSRITRRMGDLKNGLTLGRSIFTAKPRLSIFLCLLMIIGTFGVFMVTTLCGEAGGLFEPSYMFEHIDGRVVLTTQNGSVLTEEQVAELAQQYGADSYLRHDILLDEGYYAYAVFEYDQNDEYINQMRPTYGERYGDHIVGRYPTAKNEVLLYLPISYQPMFGKTELAIDRITWFDLPLTVTGVAYYYDNNQHPRCLFTSEGFEIATALSYLNRGGFQLMLSVTSPKSGHSSQWFYHQIIPSFDIEDGKIYIEDSTYQKMIATDPDCKVVLDLTGSYTVYNYFDGSSKKTVFSKSFTNEDLTASKPTYSSNYYGSEGIILSTTVLSDMAKDALDTSYRQVSLFFEDDRAAHNAAESLCEAGYIAVPSDTTYVPDASTTVMNMISGLALAFVWLLAIVFLAFFLNLCSGRALSAFKSDMAIMRSMGISVKVIRLAMYVRMLLALIPAFILVVAAAFLIFTSPKFNAFFVYLYAWQYALIFLGMLLLTLRTTHKQIRRLFGESVKKSLKGGSAE